GAQCAELGPQAMAGRDFDKAVLSARRAGDRSLELLAYEEAARLYETALEALAGAAPADEETRCELLLRLGEAQARAGDIPTAKKTFVQAADTARTAALPDRLARGALGYGGRVVCARARGDRRFVPLVAGGPSRLSRR